MGTLKKLQWRLRSVLRPERGPSFAFAGLGDLGQELDAIKRHVIDRVTTSELSLTPFGHMFIEEILPTRFYESLRAHMLASKYGGSTTSDRRQDNPAFVSRRRSLVACDDLVVRQFRGIFEDSDVKRALMSAFFTSVSPRMISNADVHHEFEYVFCAPDRHQNVHVDIPPKLVSFIFYIPEVEMTPEDARRNATVLYDDELTPHYAAQFKANSVCVFAPHHQSYHGFASTLERDVLVMFYVDRELMARWHDVLGKDRAPWTGFLDAVDEKLQRYPLREYEQTGRSLRRARLASRINAPKGRVLVDSR